MTVTGFSYAVASLGCTIGPFLDVTATMFRASNILERGCASATYALAWSSGCSPSAPR